MNDEGASRCSMLFRINHDSGIYSIPVQYVTWVESLAGKIISIPYSPKHILGVYQLHGKNINVVDLSYLLGLNHPTSHESPNRNLLIMRDTQLGFLVEKVIGVEMLYLHQNSGPMSGQLIQNVYLHDGTKELVLELDIPGLLSLC